MRLLRRRGLQTFRNGTHEWCDLLIALVEVAAELYVERLEIRQIDHAKPGVGLLKVYRRMGSIDGRPPPFLALPVPECRDPITSRNLPGWNLRRWVCIDCPRYGPAVRELQLKLEAIGMPREADRVQSLGAVDDPVHIPATVPIDAALQRTKALHQLAGCQAVDRYNRGAEEISRVGAGARDEECVGEPDHAHGKAQFRPPAALARMDRIVSVVGEACEACEREHELSVRHRRRSAAQVDDERVRLLSCVGREHGRLIDVPVLHDIEVRKPRLSNLVRPHARGARARDQEAKGQVLQGDQGHTLIIP